MNTSPEPETTAEYQKRVHPKAELDGEDAVATKKRISPPRRWFLFSVLFLLIGWETGATLFQHFTVPTPESWRAAASQVKRLRKKSEPLLFAPLWVEPLGRFYFRDQLELEELLLSDVDRYPRVWQVSIRGKRHSWLKGLKPAETWSFGRVTVELFTKPAEVVLYDFSRNLNHAQVYRIGNRLEQCQWSGDKFICDSRLSWNWVGLKLAEVDHRPYRCLYAHPVEGKVMRLHFSEVPLGRSLVVYTGIDDFASRKYGKAPVDLKIFIGTRLVRTVHHQNDWPWHRVTINTEEFASQTQAVRFEVTTENAYTRTFCFTAETRR